MTHPHNKFIIVLFIVALLASCKKDPQTFYPTNPVNTEFIHVANGKLLDGQGKKFNIHAINLGGWLLWESWIWGGGLNSETYMLNTISTRTSAEYTASFRENIYTKFITRDDIRAIAAMGLNSIRVPFNHSFFDNGSSNTDLITSRFKIIDSLISWCEAYQVYIVLDFHGLPGGQSPLFISDPDPVKVWASDENKNQAIRIWKEIAQRYKDKKIILGYDLINEPAPSNDMDMVNLYIAMIAAIRSVDANHLLIIEGSNYAKDFSIFNSVMDNNQIFSFHFYPWLVSQDDRLKQLKVFTDFANKVKVPMWCGEWGESSVTDLQSIKALLTDSSYNFCGNAFWTWKKVKGTFNSFPLNGIVADPQWTKLIGNQTKTSTESYEQIADSFLNSVNFNTNITDENLRLVLSY